jgi:hypothetical protein
MATPDELGTFLQAGGVGTLGTNLFLSKLPDMPLTCMAIVPYPGRRPEMHLGNDGIQIEFPRYQFLSRSEVEQVAMANAEVAYRLLARVANQLLSGTFYSAISVLQSPGLLTRDANNLPIVSFNFECEKVLS